MKYTIESFEDLSKLCTWYIAGEISADDYYDAVDRWAEQVVDNEVRQFRRPK